jgi:hypothetical protein
LGLLWALRHSTTATGVGSYWSSGNDSGRHYGQRLKNHRGRKKQGDTGRSLWEMLKHQWTPCELVRNSCFWEVAKLIGLGRKSQRGKQIATKTDTINHRQARVLQLAVPVNRFQPEGLGVMGDG